MSVGNGAGQEIKVRPRTEGSGLVVGRPVAARGILPLQRQASEGQGGVALGLCVCLCIMALEQRPWQAVTIVVFILQFGISGK